MNKESSLLKIFKPFFKKVINKAVFNYYQEQENDLELSKQVFSIQKPKIEDLREKYKHLKLKIYNENKQIIRICLKLDELFADFKKNLSGYQIRYYIFEIDYYLNALEHELER